jgi:hexokinase
MKGNDGSILINIESGAYDKAPLSVIDKEYDNTTANPGYFPFEKTVSGAYQGGLIFTAIKKAADEGIFSEQTAKALYEIDSLSSVEIDDFLNYPYGENILAKCCSCAHWDDDRIALYYLIDGVIERTARFIAFSLTAVMEKTGKGKNPCKPICITADGSTFHKSKLFRKKLDYYIKTFTNDSKGIYCEFVKVDQGTLIGTAIAGLLN